MNKNFLKIFSFFAFLLLFSNLGLAQNTKFKKKKGIISYITSQNIYVRFESTDEIAAGDTVFIVHRGKITPVMVIKFLSSNSCSGQKIGNVNLKVGNNVFIWVKDNNLKKLTKENAKTVKDTLDEQKGDQPAAKKDNFKIPKYKPNFYGSLTANSFSNFANYQNSRGLQRWRYSLNISAENIGGTPFYLSNYMNFSYLTTEWNDVKANVFNNLKIYDLSLGYKTNGFSAWLGRHINYNISNAGPVDGLQLEKKIGNFAIGGVAGSRPDFYSMGFNFNFLEYGAYINRTDTLTNGLMKNTIAFFQQTNHKKTDRRFLYFQHNSNIISDLYLFFSTEVDLYKTEQHIAKNDFSLTSLFLSTQYRPVQSFSVNLSYDARRSVIYYETFKSLIDSLFQNQMRQGLRLGFFIRPFTGTFINLNGGYSFQKGDIKPSKNFHISVTQSEIPMVDISATISFNRIFSNYQDGSVYGITLTKFIPFNITTISLGYSKLFYHFGSFAHDLDQKVLTAQITTRLFSPLFFNIYYEGEFEGKTTYGRIMSGFNYRF